MDISVIIPTYNRKKSLRKCLDSLLAQDYPRDRFEILVVDDGSADGTRQMLDELSQTFLFLRWFSQPHKGPAAARNLGLREASADIVGFADDDCILEKDWVRKMTEAHREDGVLAVGGLTKVAEHNIRACVSQFLSDGAIQAQIAGKKEVIFFPTCNVSLKKSFLRGDSFDESFLFPGGEDLDFFWRLFKKDHRLIYKEDIVVFHDRHPGLVSFLRQAYRYGRGNYLVQHYHKDHPLLKELKTGGALSFWAGTLVNILKVPRFTALCSHRLFAAPHKFSFKEQIQIYGYFALHKILYVFGNIVEYGRLAKRFSLEAGAKPEFIILDITHRCNLKCVICQIHKSDKMQELTTDEVKGLILQAKEWGIGDFVLSGGEALLRPDIFELLDYGKKHGQAIGVLTNGIALDESFLEKIRPVLCSGALSLCISLDSLSPANHDRIRGAAGSHEKTLEGLRFLAAMKKAEPRVNFNTISIILNENLEELLPLAEFLKSLDVNSIQFQHLLANNLMMEERSERLATLDRVIDALVAFKRQNSRFVRNSVNNLLLTKKYFRHGLTVADVRCRYADKTLLIAPNGDVTTCFDCYGNVRRNSLKKIHASGAAQRARERAARCASPCLLPCFCDY
jgi:MoaA/NifB/PqqE/SkfB family radical SAM enzyme/GT2 family glycosyltransferase